MDTPGKKSSDASNGGLAAGMTLGGGRFLLKRVLGQGGMGVVWLAHDLRLQEAVALKFLPSQLVFDTAALNDLRAETLRSRKLSHPGIIRIHDFCQFKDEPPFISMEYVDGPNLHYLRENRPFKVLKWSFVEPLLRQLCAAIDYAHSEKVVHRDLKSANLMLDSAGRLKLADFGLARVVQDSMTRVTGQSLPAGTITFMSPQQADGKAAQVSDDIYSLGATLYDLLTSRPPFYQGDIPYQVRHTRPETMASRLLDLGLVNEVPAEASALVMACLAKQPEQRPASAKAILEFLDQAKEQQNVAPAVFLDTPTPKAVAAPARVVFPPLAERTRSGSPAAIRHPAKEHFAAVQSEPDQHPTTPPQQRSAKLWVCLGAVAVMAAWFGGVYWGRHSSTPDLNTPDIKIGSSTSVAPVRAAPSSATAPSEAVGVTPTVPATTPVETPAPNIIARGTPLPSSNPDRGQKTWPGYDPKVFHSGAVYGLAFSPGGEWVASAGQDGTMRFWNRKNGMVGPVLTGHSGAVLCLAFAPLRPQLLVSGGADGTIKFWDRSIDQCVATRRAHQGAIRALAFSSDGNSLFSASLDQTIKKWSVDKGSLQLATEAHRGGVVSMALAPDGRLLATGGVDGLIKLWDAQTGATRGSFDRHKKMVVSLAFSSDSRTLASAAGDATIFMWDIEGQKLSSSVGVAWPVRALVFWPNDYSLAFSSDENWLCSYSRGATRVLAVTLGVPDTFAVSPDGVLAYGCRNGFIGYQRP